MCPFFEKSLLAGTRCLPTSPSPGRRQLRPMSKVLRGMRLPPTKKKKGTSTAIISHQHQPYPETSNLSHTGDKGKTTWQWNQRSYHLATSLGNWKGSVSELQEAGVPGTSRAQRRWQWVSLQGKLLHLANHIWEASSGLLLLDLGLWSNLECRGLRGHFPLTGDKQDRKHLFRADGRGHPTRYPL